MSADPRVDLFCPLAADLGEGVLWHAAWQTLWWVDITCGRVFEAQPGGGGVRILPVADAPSALFPTTSGGLLVLRADGVHALNPATGATTRLGAPAGHDPRTLRFNDGKCDPRGRLWAGTVSRQGRPESGTLYRLDPDRTFHRQRERVSISNGLAWSPDGGTLYYIDSRTKVVLAFDYDLETGGIARERVALDLRDRPGLPDGCTSDAEGRLWIAHWGESCVTCWDPVRARLLDTVRFPASQITNCTFGGPKLDRLFVTSAACELDPVQRRREPAAGHVFCASVGATGRLATAFPH